MYRYSCLVVTAGNGIRRLPEARNPRQPAAQQSKNSHKSLGVGDDGVWSLLRARALSSFPGLKSNANRRLGPFSMNRHDLGRQKARKWPFKYFITILQ